MTTYRELLDSWQLWHERALLDVSLRDQKATPAQVFARCNFCNQPLTLGVTAKHNPHSAPHVLSSSAPKARISSCPNCRKPLPRCSLCLLPLGCSNPTESSKFSGFSQWFTWCQTCRHGGHAQHMMDWFLKNNECPVSDCNCRCSKI